MNFLLDTNVVSETRKRTPDDAVMAWFNTTDANSLYLSVLTLGELAKGIARRRRTDPVAADSLAHWLTGIETLFADRVIPIDTAVAQLWGEMNAAAPLPVIDSLLAATAQTHDLALVTRNVRDVERTGVRVVNPWEWELG